jgi:DNA-directed RNA polymerase specialized sigma24 family protein
VDRDRALDQLSGSYARALRLAEAGRSPAQIAAELGIDEAAVAPLLHIGSRKLKRVMEDRGRNPEAGSDPDGPGPGEVQ